MKKLTAKAVSFFAWVEEGYASWQAARRGRRALQYCAMPLQHRTADKSLPPRGKVSNATLTKVK